MRALLAGVIGFSLGGMYVAYVEIVGPIFWFWPGMQVPLW
jgi:hypothetical protein